MSSDGKLRVGTSGFHYNHWKKIFYPENLAKKKWFFHYAQHFDTVEINNTFYHLPSASAFDAWKAQAPAGFIYALKFNRYGSKWMRLKNGAATIGNFLDRAARLEGRLGPILVQLLPRWTADPDRLSSSRRRPAHSSMVRRIPRSELSVNQCTRFWSDTVPPYAFTT